METTNRRPHVNKNDLDSHWKNKGYDYLFNRFSWNVADNIFDYGRDCECCWACGRVGKTQIAHIAPRAQGGSDSLDNLFLLCYMCHLESPDTSYPEFFDLFCGSRIQCAETVIIALLEVSYRYDISGIDVDRVVIDICERASSCAAPHQGRYSLSTISAIAEAVIRESCPTV